MTAGRVRTVRRRPGRRARADALPRAPHHPREPAGLAALSRRTGVHVVAAIGHVVEAQWAGVVDVGPRIGPELVAEMVEDLTVGFRDAPAVRAGVIKVGSALNGASPAERRLLRAAAAARRETGAPIVTHTTGDSAALEQVAILEGAGADLAGAPSRGRQPGRAARLACRSNAGRLL